MSQSNPQYWDCVLAIQPDPFPILCFPGLPAVTPLCPVKTLELSHTTQCSKRVNRKTHKTNKQRPSKSIMMSAACCVERCEQSYCITHHSESPSTTFCKCIMCFTGSVLRPLSLCFFPPAVSYFYISIVYCTTGSTTQHCSYCIQADEFMQC